MSVFNKVQIKQPKKTAFNLSHDNKLSLEMGKLVPFQVIETMPGDVYNLGAEALIRFAPLVAPVMHNVNVHIEHFFVPFRILWQNWEDFCSPIESGTVPPAYPVNPNIGSSDVPTYFGTGTLSDYLGIPSLPSGSPVPPGSIGLMAHAAYQQIWNDYYRDQNLQLYGTTATSPWGGPKVSQRLNDGNQVTTNSNWVRLLALRSRAWQHDYFTSALPFAQKGPAVTLPTGVIPDTMIRHNDTGAPFTQWTSTDARTVSAVRQSDPDVNLDSLYFPETTIAGITINEFRLLNVTQRFFERQARAGSRYTEYLRSQYGVVSSDKRLQRPEFIGSQRFPVVISETLQTSSTDITSPQGTMAGHAIAASQGRAFRYYCEEHGYIMSMISVTPSTAYFQGLPRHFSRRTQFDIPMPIFANIGEQAIKNKEIFYLPSNGSVNDQDFGYIPRFSEMRYHPSEVHGYFRTSLDHWHFARRFSALPGLNAQFIECNPTLDPFAVNSPGNQNIWSHVFCRTRVYRPLPKYGTPML